MKSIGMSNKMRFVGKGVKFERIRRKRKNRCQAPQSGPAPAKN